MRALVLDRRRAFVDAWGSVREQARWQLQSRNSYTDSKRAMPPCATSSAAREPTSARWREWAYRSRQALSSRRRLAANIMRLAAVCRMGCGPLFKLRWLGCRNEQESGLAA